LQKSSSLLTRFWHGALHNRKDTIYLATDNYIHAELQDNTQQSPEHPTLPRRSTYVFDKLPKKVGHMLEPNYGDEAPDGWGICFEEGLCVHRLLTVLSFYVLFNGMAIVAWRVRKFGAVGPTVEEVFGGIAWLVLLFGLLCTAWVKWAESG